MTLAIASRRLLLSATLGKGGGTVPPWVPVDALGIPAIAVLDAGNDRGWYLGSRYASEALWLTAIGGSKAANVRTIGPYVAPDAAELLGNGDFADGVTGWTGQNSGTISAVAGECVLQANSGGNPGFSRPFATTIGKAFRYRGTYRRGTMTGGCGLLMSSSAVLNGATASTPANGSATPVTNSGYGSAEATTMYAGGRAFVSGVTGTTIYDDLSVMEASPFAGLASGVMTVLVDAVAPSAFATAQAFFASNGDTGVTRNAVVGIVDTDAHIKIIVTFANSVVASLDLGAVAANETFRVAFSVATNNFRAARVGRPVVADTSGNVPGSAVIRFGASLAGQTYGGSINLAAIFPYGMSADEFEAFVQDQASIAAWGDSLTAGAGATGGQTYPAVAAAAFDPDRLIYNGGIGGQTSTEIAARQGGLPIALTVTGNEIPASGSVAVTARSVGGTSGVGPITSQGQQSFYGTLAGVRGLLARDGSGNYTFTRVAAGAATACPPGSLFTMEVATTLRARTQWLMPGRNGAASGRDTETDLAAMVAAIGHDRYLVGSILTSSSDDAGAIAAINAKNAARASLYGGKYADLMAALMAANDGSTDDLADVAAGYVPRSLRSDAVHLNNAGYAVVAATFRAAHLANSYP